MSSKLRDVSFTNHELISEKESALQLAQKCQSITTSWARSHFKTTEIVNDQIPNPCEKIIGGNFEEVVDIFKHVETDTSVPTQTDFLHVYKTKYVNGSFIN